MLDYKYEDTIKKLKSGTEFSPEISLILGSGLGDFAKSVKLLQSFNTASLPGYPKSTIEGHEGKIHFAEFKGKRLLLFQGRIHFYEGYHITECILPAFISAKLGCKYIFISNAAGGINSNFHPADLMLATSFNGLGLKKEIGSILKVPSEQIKNKFIDFPSSNFSNIIREASKLENIDLKEGVYWYSKGPSYETPAEIKMMAKFFGDAVGMSTVPEAVYAAYLGLEVASVSCITNYAAGISQSKLSHAEVTETANLVKDKFEKLVKRTITLLK